VIALDLLIGAGVMLIVWIAFKAGAKFGKYTQGKSNGKR